MVSLDQKLAVAGCFCQQALSLGFMFYTLGMFTDYIRQDFQISNTKASVISAIAGSLYYGAGPVSLSVMKKFGCRRSCIVFGMVASASVIGASAVHNYYIFLLLMGVICGFSMSIILAASYTVIPEVFATQHDRQVGFAVAVSGVGLACVCLPPLVTYFITQFTWRQALFICGAITLNLVPAGMVMPEKLTLSDQNPSDGKNKLYHNHSFLVIMSVMLAQATMASAFFTFLSPFLLHHGVTETAVGVIFVILGATSITGRLVFATFAKHVTSPSLVWCLLNVLFVAMQFLLYYRVHDWTTVIVACCCFGLLLNMSHCLFPSMITYVVSDQYVQLGISLGCTVHGIGGFLGPIIVGSLSDWLGNYVTPLSILSGVLLFAVVLLAIWTVLHK